MRFIVPLVGGAASLVAAYAAYTYYTSHTAYTSSQDDHTQPFAPSASKGAAAHVGQPPSAVAHVGQPPSAADASWSAQVQEGIRKAEYDITWQDDCVIGGAPGGLHAANRANNLRTYFREDGVQIVQRETSDPDWDLKIQPAAWGAGQSAQTFAPVTPTIDGNRVLYAYPDVQVSYTNDEHGLAFAFTANSRPSDGGVSVLHANVAGLTASTSRDGGIAFTKPHGDEVLRLANATAQDANGATLPLTLHANSGQIEFRVAVQNAAYPISVKALYLPQPPSSASYNLRLASQVEGDQKATQTTGLYPDVVIASVGVGEESGTLDDALLQVADELDRDVEREFRVLMTLLEPAMIVFVGAIVGFIVMAMILPIFDLGAVIDTEQP